MRYAILYVVGQASEVCPLILGLSQVHYSANLPVWAQLPVRPLCYDLPHLSAGATGDLYTLQLAIFRAINLMALTSKSS